jgi:hypothetical protein
MMSFENLWFFQNTTTLFVDPFTDSIRMKAGETG